MEMNVNLFCNKVDNQRNKLDEKVVGVQSVKLFKYLLDRWCFDLFPEVEDQY